MTAKRLLGGRHGWELVVLLHQVSAWMLVSKTGEITLRAPLAIDPSGSQNAKVSFRSSGQSYWDMSRTSDLATGVTGDRDQKQQLQR
eukprot:Skav222855  [mRNA]  locus=scaffold850:626230:641977:- [translate_table: standard]